VADPVSMSDFLMEMVVLFFFDRGGHGTASSLDTEEGRSNIGQGQVLGLLRGVTGGVAAWTAVL
jgi:hypothetical protein